MTGVWYLYNGRHTKPNFLGVFPARILVGSRLVRRRCLWRVPHKGKIKEWNAWEAIGDIDVSGSHDSGDKVPRFQWLKHLMVP